MPKRKKQKVASTESTVSLPLPPISLSVHGIKGFESFPTDPAVFSGCVTVDNVNNADEPSEIGSGACVCSTGLILTAGHVAPSVGAVRRIGFPSGEAFDATCIKTGVRYDLSILQIRETPKQRGKRRRSFPFVRIAELPALRRDRLVCVGQPGTRAKQRLEANVGRCVSQSKYPLENQLEVGGMVHDSPVYGGSSGSPLLHAATGELVGVHVGFDHNRFEAQAVTLQAVRDFLGGSGVIAVEKSGGEGEGREGVVLKEEGGWKEGTEGIDNNTDGDNCDSPLPLAERLMKRIGQRAQKLRSTVT